MGSAEAESSKQKKLIEPKTQTDAHGRGDGRQMSEIRGQQLQIKSVKDLKVYQRRMP